MNLKEWAASQGVSYAVARKWYRAGTLPVSARKVGGLILVETEPRDVIARTLLAECLEAGLPSDLAERVRAELAR